MDDLGEKGRGLRGVTVSAVPLAPAAMGVYPSRGRGPVGFVEVWLLLAAGGRRLWPGCSFCPTCSGGGCGAEHLQADRTVVVGLTCLKLG